MAALQAFQVIRQLHHAAHQGRTGIIPPGGLVLAKGLRQLLHFLGNHGRCVQLKHAQGAMHLVQVPDTALHAGYVIRRFCEGLDLDPRLAQGLVDFGFYPAERGVIDRIAKRRGHRDAPVTPCTNAGQAWTEMFIPTPTGPALRPAA